jgi:hypothetical protein
MSANLRGRSSLASGSAEPEVRISYLTSAGSKAEIGRCVATTGGNYQDAGCATKPASPGTGKYEWQPFPFTKAHFGLTNGVATFKTAISKTTISCARIHRCAERDARHHLRRMRRVGTVRRTVHG